jgi:hypothetical protein
MVNVRLSLLLRVAVVASVDCPLLGRPPVLA